MHLNLAWISPHQKKDMRKDLLHLAQNALLQQKTPVQCSDWRPRARAPASRLKIRRRVWHILSRASPLVQPSHVEPSQRSIQYRIFPTCIGILVLLSLLGSFFLRMSGSGPVCCGPVACSVSFNTIGSPIAADVSMESYCSMLSLSDDLLFKVSKLAYA